MAENRTRSWAIEELSGVQRNPVDRLKQKAPRDVSGFDFDRAGGYRVAWKVNPNNVTGILRDPVQSYDHMGLMLSTGDELLSRNTKLDLSSLSVKPLDRYLLPGVGVLTHPDVPNADTYTLGAYVRLTNTVGFTDPSRVTGITTTATGTSGGFAAMTVTVLAVFFAPTRTGLVAYQTRTATGVSVSASNTLTVTANDVLPTGYVMRVYVVNQSGSDAFGGVAEGTNLLRETYSDGTNAMSITFTDFDATDLTGDAILMPDVSGGLVEPHLRRVWAKASEQSFIGPFYYSYNPVHYWDLPKFYVDDTIQTVTAFTTPDNAKLDTAFDSGTQVGVVIDGIREAFARVERRWGSGIADGTYSAYFVLASRPIGSSTQFEVGWEITYIVSSGSITSAALYYYVTIGSSAGSAKWTSSSFIAGTVNLFGHFEFDFGALNRIEVTINTGTGAVSVDHQDQNGTTIDSIGVTTGLTSAMGTGGGELTFIEIQKADGVDTAIAIWFDFETMELYDDAGLAGVNLVEEIPASNWDGSSGTFTGDSLTWTLESPASTSRRGGAPALSTLADEKSSVIYSDIGYANYASSYDQYVKLGLTTSDKITGLASTPNGLLVLADNEAFLVRSDPALNDFSVNRFSGTIGCDEGIQPAKLGGTVAVIWRGRLYGINLGMGDVDFGSAFAEIGAPLYRREDPFVQVVGEPENRHFVVATSEGKLFRYDVDQQQWLTDRWSGATVGSMTLKTLLPQRQGYTTYVFGSSGSYYGFRLTEYDDENGTGDAFFTFEDVDVGDPTTVKLWRRVRVYTNEGYAGVPTLYVDLNDGTSSTLTGTDEGGGEWVFAFPSGWVSRELKLLRFNMLQAELHDTVEPPLAIEYAPRYRRR